MKILKHYFFLNEKTPRNILSNVAERKYLCLKMETYFNISFILAAKSAYTSARLISFKIS